MAQEQLEQGEIEALINELEQKMGRLRSIYEQYFMGIERMPPTTLRKDVVRLIHRLEGIYVRNTALKFKIRSLIQRFNSYKSYWNRVERQIEEGTYVRDIRRAERNQARGERRRQAAEGGGGDADDGIIELDFEEIADLTDLQAELEEMERAGAFDKRREPQPSPVSQLSEEEKERRRLAKLAEISAQLGIGGSAPTPVVGQQAVPAPQPQEPAPKPAPSAATPASRGAPQSVSGGARPATSVDDRRAKLQDIKKRLEQRTGAPTSTASTPAAPRPTAQTGGDDEARRVYNQLIEAKRRCNESTQGLSYENVATSMKKQREQLQQSRGASNVEFKVVIKDGRAFLKPETK